MKSIGKLIILILVSISLIPLLGFNQVVQEKPDKAERMAAMNAFNQKYDNQWKIRWNNVTGTPASILGHRITKYSGTLEQIAIYFLNDEKAMLGINDVETDLELTKTNYSEKGGTRLTYTQKYKGVPVLYSGYLVAVLNDGSIYYVSGDYFPDVSVDTKPAVSSSKAVEIIGKELAGKGMKIIEEPVIYVHVVDRDTENMSYRLVYKASAATEEYREAWEYIIDAKNEDILSKNSLIVDVNGTGLVYKTSPLHGDTVSVTLHRISSDYSPRKLIGENVKVYNDEASEASSANAVFKYDTSSTHFDEVMAYYHCDEFEGYFLVGIVGMEQSRVDTVTVNTHYEGSYASAIPSQRKIRLSDGDGYELDDPSKDSDVITHEYMHVVSETYNILNQNLQAKAMDEAYSDYFSVAYKNLRGVTSNVTGDYVAYPSYVRSLDNNSTFDEFVWEEGYQHQNSIIYSGASWDLRGDNDLDYSVVDELILESLNNLDSSPTFLDGRDAIITAAEVGHSDYVDDIIENFDAHKIYSSLDVDIDGPNYIYYEGHEGGEWYADVSGGESPYSYQWKALDPELEEPVWELIYWCETSTVVLSVDDLNEEFEWNLGVDSYFYLKVIVTDDDSISDSSITGIEVIEGPPKKLNINQLPKDFKLEQNYPNPFNPVTTINYQLPKSSNVTLVIYNIQGQEVARLVDGYVEAGYHSIPWKPGNASSGIYIYRLQAGIFSDTKRMLYIK